MLDLPGAAREFLHRVCRLATRLTGVEQASVSLVLDREVMLAWYPAPPAQSADGPPIDVALDDSFCRFTVAIGRAFAVPDAKRHPWARAMPCVVSGETRSYLGLPLRMDDGRVVGTICIYAPRTITFTPAHEATLADLAASVCSEFALHQERKRLEHHSAQLDEALSRARDAALQCTLTGLLNRAGLLDALGRRLDAALPGPPLSLLFLDLDGFKRINDEHGHAVGDALLIAVARRLERISRAGDVVGRLGGDEFVVAAASEPDEVEGLVQRLRIELGAPYDVDGRSITVSASIGRSTSLDLEGPAQLIERADARMYEEKRRRRDRPAAPA